MSEKKSKKKVIKTKRLSDKDFTLRSRLPGPFYNKEGKRVKSVSTVMGEKEVFVTEPKSRMNNFVCACGAEIIFNDVNKLVVQEWIKHHKPHMKKYLDMSSREDAINAIEADHIE